MDNLALKLQAMAKKPEREGNGGSSSSSSSSGFTNSSFSIFCGN
ncbi:hypothetical protein MKZ19_07445 [Shouchella clausii]